MQISTKPLVEEDEIYEQVPESVRVYSERKGKTLMYASVLVTDPCVLYDLKPEE
jgi:hypothetical protein